jgi:hypothetical protein
MRVFFFFWLAEDLLASKEGLCSMESVSWLYKDFCV